MGESEDTVLLCHRCGAELTPGQGDFYVVRILAVADPTPPTLTPEDLQADLDKRIAELVDQAAGMSESELMDQVYRRLTIHLCGRCYAEWIENPAG